MHEPENEIFDDHASNIVSINDLVKMKNEKEIMEIINKELFENLHIEKQEEMVLNQINMLNIHENDSNGKEYIWFDYIRCAWTNKIHFTDNWLL